MSREKVRSKRAVPSARTAQTAAVPALHGDAEASPEIELRATIAQGANHAFAKTADQPRNARLKRPKVSAPTGTQKQSEDRP